MGPTSRTAAGGRQVVRQEQIGNFTADFACRSLKLAIEPDGGQHSEDPQDAARTRVIELHGYRLIRFWNNREAGGGLAELG